VKFCGECHALIQPDEEYSTRLNGSPTGGTGATVYVHEKCPPAPADRVPLRGGRDAGRIFLGWEERPQ